MKTKDIKEKLARVQSFYDKEVDTVKQSLSKKIKFEFDIFYQPGDGFVISNDDGDNGDLNMCLAIIEKKGYLTFTDYKTTWL